MCSPWHHRVWIVQEAALATEIVFICVEKLFTFEHMWYTATFSQYLKDLRDKHGSLLDTSVFRNSATALHIRQLMKDDCVSGQWKLMFAATATALFHECLLPEDRVRGLLGLLQTSDLPVDLAYVGSDINILYTKLAKHLPLTVNPQEPLWWDWLRYAAGFNRSKGLPSWVPDLHHMGLGEGPTGDVILQTYGNDPDQHISRLEPDVPLRTRASARVTTVKGGEGWNEVLLKGKIVDEVREVYDTIPSSSSVPSRPPHLPEAKSEEKQETHESSIAVSEWEECIADAVLHNDPEGIINGDAAPKHHTIDLEIYYRTLRGDATNFDMITVQLYEEFRLNGQLLRKVMKHLDTNPSSKVNGIDVINIPIEDQTDRDLMDATRDVFRLFCDMLQKLTDRQLFLSKEGGFGYAILGVQPGDVVCVFAGVPTPHILRNLDNAGDQSDRWQFVGDAYVHGLMKGEADAMDVEEKYIVLV
ncbi:hypothetical protein EK21DRAFT_91278 [Setomelanomma holmii]|uniref:Heterokaryon incompatibility domain-containing protein n=1 Tax=Setomelanomma holmii TaxID=210430 RepID=A0A9P4H595_9PLEO|nr:hypothetical protein EK21DRAFT_91278 [Setomelanomma holmii]